jgi:TonB family protein
MCSSHRIHIVLSLAIGAALSTGGAQEPARRDTSRCDSVVAAARVDSIAVALSIRAFPIDGSTMTPETEEIFTTAIAGEFIPPRPFRLTVFSSGAPATQVLRVMSTKSGLRSPTVTGVYRFQLREDGTVSEFVVARLSLVPGFDSAVVVAIQKAAREKALPRFDGQLRQFEVRLSTDSLPGGRRMSVAEFPRMPVVDAVAKPNNPTPEYPPEEKRDSVEGNVVLRFIVDRDGEPIVETTMVVRATTRGFMNAALVTLPKLRFMPATIKGCAVAQVVDYPFNFVLPPGGVDEPVRGIDDTRMRESISLLRGRAIVEYARSNATVSRPVPR